MASADFGRISLACLTALNTRSVLRLKSNMHVSRLFRDNQRIFFNNLLPYRIPEVEIGREKLAGVHATTWSHISMPHAKLVLCRAIVACNRCEHLIASTQCCGTTGAVENSYSNVRHNPHSSDGPSPRYTIYRERHVQSSPKMPLSSKQYTHLR